MASETRNEMRGVPHAWLWKATLTLLLGSTVWAWNTGAAPIGAPNPATGQIKGKTALTVVPQALGMTGDLPPWGFMAHLTGHDDPSIDITFPCGIWNQPPGGRYRVWVEGDWQISPFTHVIGFSPRPFGGAGMVTSARVVDAGRVTLPAGFKQERTRLTLRLLHAGSYLEEGFPRWELSRRKAADEVGEGVLMPVGLTLGALWDERGERYVALSRPFEVRHRETVPVPFEVPLANTSHLVAQIQRVALARDADDAKMRIMLGRSGSARAPDVQVSAADRSYAVWYNLPPGHAELRAETRDEVLQTLSVSLASGKIERIFGEMINPPAWAQAPQH